MREVIFKRIINILDKHPSKLLARIQIQILVHITAKAFQKKERCVLFSKNALMRCVEYTKACIDAQGERDQLYQMALRLGKQIRKLTGFTDPEDLKRLVFLLYRNIGITMTGEIPGEILVTECYFSNMYSAKHCMGISAMDRGVIVGICDIENLRFTERITEGYMQCKVCALKRGEKDE